MKSFPSSQRKNGFTLLETLIAITILSISLAAAFAIAQKSLQSSAFSKNQTTAFFLATEGLELVRDVRDNIALYNAQNNTSYDWLTPFKESSICNNTLTGTCIFDINPLADLQVRAGGYFTNSSTVIKLCPAEGCRLSIFGSSGSLYYTSISNSGAGSVFYRKISIIETCYTDWTGETTQSCSTVNPNGKRQALVTSTVSWLGETFSITETLTNWQ